MHQVRIAIAHIMGRGYPMYYVQSNIVAGIREIDCECCRHISTSNVEKSAIFSVVLALFSIFTTNFLEMHQTYLLEICFGEQHCYE